MYCLHDEGQQNELDASRQVIFFKHKRDKLMEYIACIRHRDSGLRVIYFFSFKIQLRRMLKRSPELIAKDTKKFKVSSLILTEASMGITEYASKSTYFTGIIKHRFNDFHVHEVRGDEIIHLKGMSVPIQAEEVVVDEIDYSEMDAEKKSKLLADLVVEDQGFQTKFLEFLNGTENCLTTIEINEKSTRTSIHQLVRKTFGDQLDTKTDGTAIVILKKSKNQKSNRDRSKPRLTWAQLGGDYCHFTLFKENRDTMDALGIIAKSLRVPTKTFSFAGTKDKRAITTQRISAYRLRAEQLVGLNKRLNNIKIGDFTYEKKGLSLADSNGNHFIVALRDVKTASHKDVHGALENLKNVGFINYYGMQRFGTRSVSTHEVGIAMLNAKWEDAVNLILGMNETEKPDIQEARDCWIKEKDPKKALNLFPRYCTAERAVLGSLEKQGDRKDYLQAMQAIPRNLRLMYVHAYQSRVWNEMVSLRHRLFGLEVVVGDIVRIKDDAAENTAVKEEIEPLEKQDKKEDLVKILTQNDDLKEWTIYDVVLPLPGFSMLYPTHAVGESYTTFMAQHGLDPLKMASKTQETNLPGSYRNIICKPRNVNGRVFTYSEPSESEIPDFIVSDLERIQGRQEKEIVEGDKVGVVVEFTLGSSQYATMALREITKSETSASFQSQLSQDTKKEYDNK